MQDKKMRRPRINTEDYVSYIIIFFFYFRNLRITQSLDEERRFSQFGGIVDLVRICILRLKRATERNSEEYLENTQATFKQTSLYDSFFAILLLLSVYVSLSNSIFLFLPFDLRLIIVSLSFPQPFIYPALSSADA